MASPENLAEYNALIEQCGCCPAPRCCPPEIECQSGYASIAKRGFLIDDSTDSDDATATRYLAKRETWSAGGGSTYSAHPDGVSPDWESYTLATSAWDALIQEYSSMMMAGLGGDPAAGNCYVEEADLTTRCEFGGSDTETYYAMSHSTGDWVRYISSVVTHTYTSAEGDETEDHIAWEIEAAAWDVAHPDYAAEHAAWVIEHAAWETAYQAWLDGGEIGDPPEEPVEPPPRPEEPIEFYGSCTCKIVTSQTDYNEDGDIVFIETWTSYYSGVGHPFVSLGTTYAVTYEDAVTHAEFQAAAAEWVQANYHRIYDGVDTSTSSDCAPGASCSAVRYDPDGQNPAEWHEEFFRYRIKLNKCCGFRKIASRWLTVFYPETWLDWEARVLAGDSDTGTEPEPGPDREVKAWAWEGEPPLCNDSASVTDPYDDLDMWSPFSLVVFVPTGKFGMVLNRNYQQKCYESALWDDMPDVFGTDEGSASV